MNDSTVDPRARMRQLRAIPDGQRTDAEWDELHELEIRLAPGNRAPTGPGNEPGNPGRPPQGQPSGAPKKKFFHKRPRKPGPGTPPG